MDADLEILSSVSRKQIDDKGFILFLRTVAVTVIVLAGAGRTEANETRFGLRVGFNGGVTNMDFSSFGGVVTWDDESGVFAEFSPQFHTGVSVDIPIVEMEIARKSCYLGVNPSILFVWKSGQSGIKHSNQENDVWYDGTYKIDSYHLDVIIPVSIERQYSDARGRLEVGPYVGFGLFGEQVLTVPTLDITHKESAFSSDGLSRVDIGLSYGVVFELLGFYIGQHIGSGFTGPRTTFYYTTIGYTF